ncbi:hypothetical protein P4B35_21800 [Pontiellaceae bacterium B12227]|nr:hypothetical protein [Pontiellaceae bacterium B12227]
MMHLFRVVLLLVILLPAGLYGQEAAGPEGIRWKGVEILPKAVAVEAYDDRVQYDGAGSASSDFYTEVSAGAEVRNLPARYNFSASGSYGYRFYSTYDSINDDFYDVSASVGSDANALQWSISSDLAKTLNYNKSYDPATGTGPDSILTDDTSRRLNTQGSISYVMPVSDKIAVVPVYALQHYYLEGGESAEWLTHSAGAAMKYVYSPKTTFLVGGYYDLQIDDDENGNVFSVNVGAERVISDKTSLHALVGYGYANYDLSGSSQGVLSDIRAQWQATEKVSTYIFYGNDYQPGYGGNPARMLYRAGYGAGWQPLLKWTMGAQVLHSYEDPIGSDIADSVYGGGRHFFTMQCRYAMTDKLALSLAGNYVNDEEPVNQTVVVLRLSYAY